MPGSRGDGGPRRRDGARRGGSDQAREERAVGPAAPHHAPAGDGSAHLTPADRPPLRARRGQGIKGNIIIEYSISQPPSGARQRQAPGHSPLPPPTNT